MNAHRWSVVAVVLSSSCASSLATRQTAKTLEPGHFAVDGAFGGGIPLGTIGQVVGVGVQQAVKLADAVQNQTPYAVTDGDKQDLISAAVALIVNPPSATFEGGLRYGAVDNLDVGLRYSVYALRLDAKFRFFKDVQKGWRRDVAVGMGASRYLFSNPAFQVLEFVQLDDFSRWDFEVPVYASAEWGEWFRLYGAAKYVFSRTELDEKLVTTAAQATFLTGIDFQLADTVAMHFWGGSVGVKLGYRYVFAVLELTAGYAIGSVRVLGAARSLSGPVLYPSLGLDIQL